MFNISTSEREEIACEAFGCLDCISAEYFYAAVAAKLYCDNTFIDSSARFIRMTKKLCRGSEEWGRAVHAAMKISEHFGGYLRMNDLMSILDALDDPRGDGTVRPDGEVRERCAELFGDIIARNVGDNTDICAAAASILCLAGRDEPDMCDRAFDTYNYAYETLLPALSDADPLCFSATEKAVGTALEIVTEANVAVGEEFSDEDIGSDLIRKLLIDILGSRYTSSFRQFDEESFLEEEEESSDGEEDDDPYGLNELDWSEFYVES